MLVLASNSPRRRRLLAFGGWNFKVVPADVNEDPRAGEPPVDYVTRLAREKALAVAPEVSPDSIIVAADTTVVNAGETLAGETLAGETLAGEILGKPADEAQAAEMLRRLRGRVHQVYTAIALLRVKDRALLSDWCRTDVRMRAYSEAEIADYVASGDPLDKAGGYAIQSGTFDPVEEIQGCYANVVGLPLCLLARLLRKLGESVPQDLPECCQGKDFEGCSIGPLAFQEDQ
jgi:MAF protein